MNRFLLFICFLPASLLAATPRLSFADLQNGGWERYNGQTVVITTPLVVCATMYDSLILSDERLYVPEERAQGLADGDSTAYWQHVAYNRHHRIKLECKYPYHLNLGATVTNLQARIMAPRHLQTGAQPSFRNYKPSKRVAQKGDLRICAANVQNYFVHVGGYATRRNTQGQHALQRYKTSSALTRVGADLYALCEMEQGSVAPRELTAAMNAACRHDRYGFILTDSVDRDTISCGFIYNKERVRPRGDLHLAYRNHSDIHAHRFLIQQFEDLRTGRSFYVSLNHPRSKRGDAAEANRKRCMELDTVFAAFGDLHLTPDSMVLWLGDYNSYGQEQSVQKIVRAGYADLTARDSLGYSYGYKGEFGYLDRCFASPSMAAHVTSVCPLHWNTDYYYSAAYYSKYNFKNRAIPKSDPCLSSSPRCTNKPIRRLLSPAAKRNLLFRYSDHDPLLITLTW